MTQNKLLSPDQESFNVECKSFTADRKEILKAGEGDEEVFSSFLSGQFPYKDQANIWLFEFRLLQDTQ